MKKATSSKDKSLNLAKACVGAAVLPVLITGAAAAVKFGGHVISRFGYAIPYLKSANIGPLKNVAVISVLSTVCLSFTETTINWSFEKAHKWTSYNKYPSDHKDYNKRCCVVYFFDLNSSTTAKVIAALKYVFILATPFAIRAASQILFKSSSITIISAVFVGVINALILSYYLKEKDKESKIIPLTISGLKWALALPGKILGPLS